MGRRVHKRDNGLCPSFCLGESWPPAPTLMLDTSVSPCMPLVPFKLLPCCWISKGMSLSKSMCGFFQRNFLGLQKFLPPTQPLLVFVARNYGDLSSWHWNPGLCVLVWAWDPSLPRYLSWIFIHHTLIGDLPAPPISLDGCGFFNSVVIRLPFSWISHNSEWWFFYNLVVILMQLCKEDKPCLLIPPSWLEVPFISIYFFPFVDF